MSIVKMKEVSIIGKLADLDSIATDLGKSGIFHVDDAISRYSDSSDFTAFNEENPYTEALQAMRESVGKVGKELTLLDKEAGKRWTADEAVAYANDVSSKLREWDESHAKAVDKVQEYSDSIDAMAHFVGMNLDLDEISNCEYVNVRFGSLPKENLQKLEAYKENKDLIFTPCTEDDTNQWGIFFVPVQSAKNALTIDEIEEGMTLGDSGEVERVFRGVGFKKVMLETMKGKPEDTVADLRAKKAEEEGIVRQTEANIDSFFAAEQANINSCYTYLAEKNVFYSAICRNAVKYDDNFILIGWIPNNEEKNIREKLSAYKLIELSFKGGKEVERYNPPVTIKNPIIFRPYEMFTKMFGVPGPHDFDPTPFIAIVYTIFFGIMFGDVGQGACIAAIGYIFMWKMKGLGIGRILLPCGISSIIFGFFYGSIFGVETWLNPVHQGMGIALNHHAGKFVEVLAGDTSPYIIYATMGLGVIVMTIAMIMNIINKFSKGLIGEALFGTAGCAGLAFYIGMAGLLANLIVGDLCEFIGFNGFSIGWLLGMLLAPLVIIFFHEPLGSLVEGKGWHLGAGIGDFIMQNFFELIEVAISAMSNVMSYLRVGAFVLVHAGMMQVVYSLALAFGEGNAVIYVIIAVIGNGVISVLECLLVCIQVLRLNYYELFNRYYLGDGREYTPVVASELVNAEQA